MVKSFKSTVDIVGRLTLPAYADIRVMMMPFKLDDIEKSISDFLDEWIPALTQLRDMSDIKSGVAYLTIDELFVEAGKTHRRPGLHVDGIGPTGDLGGWGGPPPGGWGAKGMLLVASHVGCVAYNQEFIGWPEANGDCSKLIDQCNPENEIVLEPNVVYSFSGMTVHKPLIFENSIKRQFLRLSMPSDAPWFEGYTQNPMGVLPTGKILPPRPVTFMKGL